MDTTLAPPRARTRGDLVLIVASAAPLLAITNFAAPLILLPQTAAALGTAATAHVWILNAVTIGMAAPMLALGSLADNLGRRRVFTIGAWTLAAASLLAALAPNTAVFVAARIVQGMAGAALLTTSLGILNVAFPDPKEKRKATSVYGAMAGAGMAVGVLAAAGLDALWGWNAPYWAFAVVAALIAIGAKAVLPESKAEHPRRVDVAGTLSLGAGMAALMAGLIRGQQGWTDPLVIALIAAGAVLGGVFVAVELRSREPMIDLRLFGRPMFVVATVGALVLGLAVIAVVNVSPSFWQQRFAITTAEATWLFAFSSGTAFVVSLLVRNLPLEPDRLLMAGFGLEAVGTVLLMTTSATWSWTMAWISMLGIGIAYGFINTALARLAIVSVPADRGSMGAGANNAARYLGAALGLPILVAIQGSAGMVAALWVCVGLLVAAAAWFALLSRR
ncbi:MFS transporter [Glycomyces arizonensis]|uniref:MFS transporter n=1 Tax=Glycomyces arizonensis TaxID=256035 RepID=UPI00040A8FD9|nr:MFS transporter [Glycomyces arizonensis]